MIIQNKSTQQRITIAPENWETMKQMGFHKHWVIVDNTDEAPVITKEIPREIIDFSEGRKEQEPVDKVPEPVDLMDEQPEDKPEPKPKRKKKPTKTKD